MPVYPVRPAGDNCFRVQLRDLLPDALGELLWIDAADASVRVVPQLDSADGEGGRGVLELARANLCEILFDRATGFSRPACLPRVAQIRFTGTPARLWRRMRPPQPIDSSSGCAITSRRPWAFSIATHDSPAPLLLASVLHLPGMIERVPRHASGDIRHRPLLDSIRIRQALENRLAERSHGRLLRAFRLLQAQADLPCVTPLSAEDVDEHRVTIPSPAARPLAQGRGSLRDNLVEILPASRDQISHAFGLLGVERPGFIFGRDSGRAEIRGGIAPEAFDNFEGWVGRERNPGQPGHGRVSRRIGR